MSDTGKDETNEASGSILKALLSSTAEPKQEIEVSKKKTDFNSTSGIDDGSVWEAPFFEYYRYFLKVTDEELARLKKEFKMDTPPSTDSHNKSVSTDKKEAGPSQGG